MRSMMTSLRSLVFTIASAAVAGALGQTGILPVDSQVVMRSGSSGRIKLFDISRGGTNLGFKIVWAKSLGADILGTTDGTWPICALNVKHRKLTILDRDGSARPYYYQLPGHIGRILSRGEVDWGKDLPPILLHRELDGRVVVAFAPAKMSDAEMLTVVGIFDGAAMRFETRKNWRTGHMSASGGLFFSGVLDQDDDKWLWELRKGLLKTLFDVGSPPMTVVGKVALEHRLDGTLPNVELIASDTGNVYAIAHAEGQADAKLLECLVREGQIRHIRLSKKTTQLISGGSSSSWLSTNDRFAVLGNVLITGGINGMPIVLESINGTTTQAVIHQ